MNNIDTTKFKRGIACNICGTKDIKKMSKYCILCGINVSNLQSKEFMTASGAATKLINEIRKSNE